MRSLLTILLSCIMATTVAFAGEVSTQPLYDYDLQVTDGQSRIHLSVYPSAPPAARIVVNSSDDESLLEDFMESIESRDSDALTNIWCDQLKTKMPDTTSVESMPDGRLLYRFRPVAGPEKSASIYEHLEAEVIMSAEDQQILSFEMGNTAPFKPAVVAKINSFQFSAVCFPLREGKTALKSMTISISGSAFLQPFSEFSQRRYSGFREAAAKRLGSP